MTEKELLASLSPKENSVQENQEELASSDLSDVHEEQLSVDKQEIINIDEQETSSDENKLPETSEDAPSELNSQIQGTSPSYVTAEETDKADSSSEVEPAVAEDEEQAPPKEEQEENHEKNEIQVKPSSEVEATKKKEEEKKVPEEPMTLISHLRELRKRLTRVVAVIFVGFFACYGIAKPVYDFLAIPLVVNMPENASLIYTSPPGAFFVYLKVSLVLSFFLSSPYTFYQIWAFIAPGLYREEKRMLIPLSMLSAFFFFAGATFCYFLVFPIAFKFFMGFATDAITPMISIEEYLSFVIKLLIAFGLVFEMPLFAFFLARLGLLTAQKMRKWRKYAVLLTFICAALLTPPDIFSQLLMAGPMLLLYEISVFIVAAVQKKPKKEEKSEDDDDSDEDPEEKKENREFENIPTHDLV